MNPDHESAWSNDMGIMNVVTEKMSFLAGEPDFSQVQNHVVQLSLLNGITCRSTEIDHFDAK